MADKEFILQGFTTRTHADAIRELFDVEDIERVIISVAFVTESGVQEIAAKLAPHVSKTTVFAGVRNDITSHQGLKALLPLSEYLYAVDTGSRLVIFHPKLFLVRGKDKAKLVIGSANLTLGGLNNNIEAGMLLAFDLKVSKDKATVSAIESELRKLPKDYPHNVLQLQDVTEIDDLLASGKLTDELAIAPPRPSSSAGSNTDTTPRIKLKVPALRRALKKAKAAVKPSSAKGGPPSPAAGPATSVPAVAPIPKTAGIQYELVWESKSLTERDLNIPKGTTTNKTGSINLDKGLLPESVDHRHYFRNSVFNQLHWTATSVKTTEEAYAKFHLVINGISYGQFDLRIGHTIGTTSKAYKQNNAMTRLSWGPMKTFVGRPSLKGRTLALYRDLADPTRFVLEID